MAAKYDTDFYAWTQETAQAIRERRWSDLDTENLLEEIESMGKSERRGIGSRLEILLSHLLKRHYQPDEHTRSWDMTIREQRLQISDLFEENPSLRARVEELIQRAYRVARLRAARQSGLAEDAFPVACPWAQEQVLEGSDH
jgi:acyl carrier protein phosphodiesterase